MADEILQEFESTVGSGKPSDVSALARGIVKKGKDAYHAAEDDSIGTGATNLAETRGSIIQAQDKYGKAPYSDANAMATIALIAARIELKGYEGSSFAHHNVSDGTIAKAQKEYANVYDKRNPNEVAQSILTSLHADHFDKTKGAALEELKKIKIEDLRILDQNLKSLKSDDTITGKVDSNAEAYKDVLQKATNEKLYQDNLVHFTQAVRLLGAEPVNLKDHPKQIVAKGLLAYANNFTVSNVGSLVKWSHDAPMMLANVAPPAAPAAAAPPPPAPAAAAPSAATTNLAADADKARILAAADKGESLYASNSVQLDADQAKHLHDFFVKKLQAAKANGSLASMKVEFAASGDGIGSDTVNQAKSAQRLKAEQAVFVAAEKDAGVKVADNNITTKAQGRQGEVGKKDQSKRHAAVTFS